MRLLIALFVVSCSLSAFAQDHAPVWLSLAEDNSFVVSSPGFTTAGLNFKSASGSLRPIPPGGNDAPAAPFTTFLSNDPNHITYVAPKALGAADVTIAGSIKLASGWDESVGGRDIVFEWGDGPTVVPVPLPFDFYDGGVTPGLPNVSVSGRTMLFDGFTSPTIRSFTFSSTDGVLGELDIPDSWSVITNSDSTVSFTSDQGIDLDLLSQMELGWAASVDNAVFVSFELDTGVNYGPFALSSSVPEPASATTALLGAVLVATLRRRSRQLRLSPN